MPRSVTAWLRLGAVAAVGALVGFGYRLLNGDSVDGGYFAYHARGLFHSTGLHLYADKGLQAGPWQVAAFAVTGSGAAFAVVTGALTALALVAATRLLARAHGLDVPTWTELAVLALGSGWGLVSGAYSSGHPAELVIPLLWGLTAYAAVRARPVLAGLALAAGAGWETWALLGLPLLLLVTGSRKRVVAAAVAVVGSAAVYVPFVVVGPFRMGDVRWLVSPSTLAYTLGARGAFSWADRMIQATAVLAAGALVVALVRRTRVAPEVAIWLCPAVLAFAKVVTDPSPYSYYWLPVQALVLVGAASCWRRHASAVAWSIPVLAVSLVNPLHRPLIELAALIVVIGSLLFRSSDAVTVTVTDERRERLPALGFNV